MSIKFDKKYNIAVADTGYIEAVCIQIALLLTIKKLKIHGAIL